MNELEQAVDLVENGWCTGNLYWDGKVCAAGAVYAAHKGYSPTRLAELTYDEQISFENEAAQYVNESESGSALAQEIVEQGKNRTARTEGAYSIIWTYNDAAPDIAYNPAGFEAHKYDVIETMKKASKRL
jgi:uncharacterized protein YfiM (DUF2279 family)